MATLLLRLAAPLQSWGSSSVYDQRETDDFPTKSGVTGLLAAALGRKRGEPLDDLNELRYGVRIDLPGVRQQDFQVTDMGEKLNKNISNRVYLCDAIFLVGLYTENKAFLEKLEEAVSQPRFSLFLGRRSCPPAMPVNLGIRDLDLEEALRDEEWLVPEWRRKALFRYSDTVRLRIITDAKKGEGDIALKRDVAESFSPFKRKYRYRPVKERSARTELRPDVQEGRNKERDVRFDDHDPMKELG